MPKRKQKLYTKPKKMYDSARISEEHALAARYGLKNMQEIWRADYAIGKMRKVAKKLITETEEEQNEFIKKLQAKGFDVQTIADVLALDKEDYLKRRLESILVAKKLATTPKQARQFITHRHVSIGGNIINSPSHLTTVEEEGQIELTLKMPTKTELTKKETDLIKDVKKAEAEKGEEAAEAESVEAVEKPAEMAAAAAQPEVSK